MQTLKTAIVVVLLLVVFYGVFEMLNSPPVKDSPIADAIPPGSLEQPDIDFGDISSPSDATRPGEMPSAPALPAFNASPPDLAGDSTTFPAPPSPGSHYGVGSPPAATASGSPGGAFIPPATPPATKPPQPSIPPVAASPQTPSSQMPSNTADAMVLAIPGGPQMQPNPYVNQEIVPKPAMATTGARAYQSALKSAQSLIAEGDYRTALEKLSVYYKSPDLTAEQHRELLDLLDPLAGRVVFSREHLVERPYEVRRNETLLDIAQQYNVPYQLLQKINGIENPNVLLPGSELKVLSGPFRADVDLQTQELTIFLGALYAGRFPITLGQDPQPMEGEFQIRDKQLDKDYFSMDGRTIPASSPANPFGGIWLDLGREVCIHGSPMGGGEQQRGCISLSPRDAGDVYGILSLGSRVRILR